MIHLFFQFALAFVALGLNPPEGFGPETVINFSGYEVVNNTRHLFYWFFESRSSPSTDPFILWMTGGPGCSGMLALITENGPYKLAADGKTLSLNPYSWNSHANVMWIDQPVGAGYSYDDSLVDIGVVTEEQMAENMFEFLQKWFTKYTKYSKLPFYIAAESYGGHYGPALSAYILKHNSDQFLIPLKGLMIGNGLVVPEVQYAYYAKYAIDHKVIKPAEYDVMIAALPACLALIHNCAVNSSLGWLICFNAYDVCNMAELIPVTLGGVNPYDVRLPCEVQPLCYNFSRETTFFGSEETKKALGVPSTVSWKMCNRVTDLKLVLAGDWMLSYGQDIPILLSKGVGVLVYHGDQDFICNWYGGIHWTKNLDWEGKSAFNSAPNTTWNVMDEAAGSYISALNFTFLRVYDAGHMVPHDKPAAALQMISDFMAGKFPQRHLDIELQNFAIHY